MLKKPIASAEYGSEPGKTSRRNFILSAAAATIAGTNILKANYNDLQDTVFQNPSNTNWNVENTVLPSSLRKGSKIAITAPASPTSMGEIANTINVFKKLGCSVEVGNTIKNRQSKYRYFSASDDERAAEFMEYIERQDIDCILCGRGGYGVMRILPALDYEIIKNNPKIIIGFSDITALLNAIYYKSNIVSFHGPVACINFGKFTIDNLVKVLFDSGDFKPIKSVFKEAEVIIPGKASGVLVGGNLSMVAATLGTPYEIDTNRSILFLEEVSEEPYKIDKMLTQLWLAGKLQQCNGIILGYFRKIDAKRNFWPVTSFTLRNVLESRLKPLGIPCMMGLPIGHDHNIMTIPIGTKAEFNTKTKTFTLLESSTKI